MKYPITEYDKELLLQKMIQYQIKINVTNKNRQVIDILYGISDFGNINIDSASDVRRVLSFSIQLEEFVDNIEDKIGSWIGFYYDLYIGILDIRTDKYIYYPNGRYCITQASTKYDKASNSIYFDLSDRMTELNGTRNGQIGGSPIISIPKEIDGKKQTLREVTLSLLSSSTNIDKYMIDDIGEFYGMPENNKQYLDYRKKNEEWNILPYDLEYSSGANMTDILFEIRDLYPNCQMYFDVYDNFCYDMIPSLTNDLPDLDKDYLQKIIVADNSEEVSYEISSIRNVTEVFGKTYDIDRYCEKSSYANKTYTLTLDSYNSYSKYDIIAFVPTFNNTSVTSIAINSLSLIPLYKEYTEEYIDANTLEADKTCVIEIFKTGENNVAYYLGQYQPHALCVLTNNKNDTFYSKSYFSQKYNVHTNNIFFREETFSPFAVQRFGEVLDSKSGDTFENILSDSNAVENAKYYNKTSSTMFDTVTITTKLIPWLDVNVKINYKKEQEDLTYSYIVKNIQSNLSSGTSTITMYRFMQLYE